MDAKTQKSELTRAAIVGAGIDLASAEGLEAITLQAVADRIGLSKSGVFSRVGSREALQKAVIEEFGRRFLADVFVPAMQLPKGLPRLNEIVQRWIVRMRDVEAHSPAASTAPAPSSWTTAKGRCATCCWARSRAGAPPCAAPCCRRSKPATSSPTPMPSSWSAKSARWRWA